MLYDVMMVLVISYYGIPDVPKVGNVECSEIICWRYIQYKGGKDSWRFLRWSGTHVVDYESDFDDLYTLDGAYGNYAARARSITYILIHLRTSFTFTYFSLPSSYWFHTYQNKIWHSASVISSKNVKRYAAITNWFTTLVMSINAFTDCRSNLYQHCL